MTQNPPGDRKVSTKWRNRGLAARPDPVCSRKRPHAPIRPPCGGFVLVLAGTMNWAVREIERRPSSRFGERPGLGHRRPTGARTRAVFLRARAATSGLRILRAGIGPRLSFLEQGLKLSENSKVFRPAGRSFHSNQWFEICPPAAHPECHYFL